MDGMTATTAPPSTPVLTSKRITPDRLRALAARVVTGGEREAMAVEQPFTGQPLGEVPRSAAEDVAAAVARAREAQTAWARTTFAQRRAILHRFHDLVLSRQDEILDLIQLEAGKARRHAFEEIL